MSSYIVKQTDGDTSWFIHDRFGMFIHFGLYSCGARGEWFKSKEELSDDSYDRYFRHFDPDLFDARQWAQRAKAAGMKYAVLTAKHHDGFCLFDSRYTDYKSTNTPAGRDFVKEYVEAFREAGLKVGIYYSLIDWHHSDYQIDVFHPLRRSPGAQAANETRSMERYREYLTCQVKELLCNYGKLDIFWFDFTYPDMRSIDNEANQFAIHDYQSWMPWTRGAGWWGSNDYADYYENLGTGDDPFSYIKVIPLIGAQAQIECGGFDHAGKYETSLMMACYPDHVDLSRCEKNTEWFAESAKEATMELGEHMQRCTLRWLEQAIQ